MVTIALKRVENPLEFGVVVVNDEGRIERFLEKPTWGQVFSDTVNTGIYVLEPEIFDHIPEDGPFDFSQDLFPKLFAMGAPLYGYVADGYWQDIGSLPQYLSANRDLLDGKVTAEIPGIELHDRIFVGEGINLDSLENISGPAFIGNYGKIAATANIGKYTVLGNNVVVKDHADVRNSVVGSNTYIGSSAKVYGTILGRNCDVKAGATFSEGSAIGDESVIGEQAYIAPDVKIYPYKTVEAGAQVHSSIIWESRGSAQLFGRDGIVGLINVDITAELALNVAMAYGTMLKKGARVTTSRDAHPASRVIKRALICGLSSTGVVVRDLRVASSAVNRFEVKSGASQGGMHVRISSWDPEMIQIQVFEPPGISLSEKRQKDIEKYYGRRDFRRAFYSEFGELEFPDRAHGDLRARAPERLGHRAHPQPRLPARHRLLLLAGVAGAAQHPRRPRGRGAQHARLQRQAARQHRRRGARPQHPGGAAPGHDHGGRPRGGHRPGRRAHLPGGRRSDTRCRWRRRCCSSSSSSPRTPGSGDRIVLPLTVTRLAEKLAGEFDVEVPRTKVSLPELAKASLADDVVFAGTLGGGYIFPEMVPAYDAIMSLGKLLELLAPQALPLSEQLAQIPASTLVHKTAACPWTLKGTVMRTATEHLQRTAADGDEISLVDGIEVHNDAGWVQLLPDADEPVFHVYAEGRNRMASERLAEELLEIVRGVIRENG